MRTMRIPTAPMKLRVVAAYAAIGFVLYFVISDPAGAAHIVNNIGDFLAAAARGLAAFYSALPLVVVILFPVTPIALYLTWWAGRLLRKGRSWTPILTNLLTGGLAGIGAFLAGRQRAYMRDAWYADLVRPRDPGQGRSVSSRKKIVYAASLVKAGARCRIADGSELWWRLADGILASRLMSRLILIAPCLTAITMIARHEGMYGLVVNAENLLAIGSASVILVHGGRKLRKIAVKCPPKPPQKISNK